MSPFLICLFAYLLGSIPTGWITTRLVKGVDIREHGSKNTGATNVFRVVGKKWGIFVFVLDVLKGYLAVQFAAFANPTSFYLALGLGVIAILGHSFSIWLKFKGGKGVATSLGVFLALASVPTLIAFGLWIAVFTVTHIISISSLFAALVFPVTVFMTYRNTAEFAGLFPVSLLLTVFIFYTHRTNIQRLINKEEKRLF